MISLFAVFAYEDSKSCFLAFEEQFFSFMWKNALKMRRMRKLVNYADPHHCILSDA